LRRREYAWFTDTRQDWQLNALERSRVAADGRSARRLFRGCSAIIGVEAFASTAAAAVRRSCIRPALPWPVAFLAGVVAFALALAPEAHADRGRRAAVPTLEQAARAGVFAAGRAGLVSFAVIDTRGRLRCHQCWRRYVSASVVKAMLLVAYLQRLEAEGRPLTSSDRGVLGPMIRYSDNAAATAAFSRAGGDAALYRLALRAGMERFDVHGSWGSAQITAADQARFFARLPALTPTRFRGYVRSLLSTVVAWQSWGIPELSRPGWRTFFKGGWRGTFRGQLVHQAARLERDGAAIALAILTDGNSSHGYGRQTIRGVAASLLRGARLPGKPWPSPLPDWFWAWGRWYLHHAEFKSRPIRSGASRPTSAPRPVPMWTWARLEALVQAAARPSRKPWPLPLARWFWPWARWYLHRGEFRSKPFRSLTTRPASAPRPVPAWAWKRLRELLPR
jgi:hypothetical protein